MRPAALLLALVGMLVGAYAAAVGRPQYERARSEWLRADPSDAEYEYVEGRREGHRAHLQMLTLVAGFSSVAGLGLALAGRKDEGSRSTVVLLIALVGVICSLIAGVAGGLF